MENTTAPPVSIPRMERFKPTEEQRESLREIVTQCERLSDARRRLDSPRLRATVAALAADCVDEIAACPDSDEPLAELLQVSPLLVQASTSTRRAEATKAARQVLQARIRAIAQDGRGILLASVRHDLSLAERRLQAVREAEAELARTAELATTAEPSPTVKRLAQLRDVIANDLAALADGRPVDWQSLKRILAD